MLTIAPPRAAITGTAYLEARNAVRRLTAKAWSQASSVVSTTVPSEASPMLFARMSTVPKASTATWIPDRHGRRLGRGRGHAGRALRPGGRRRRAVRDHQPARRGLLLHSGVFERDGEVVRLASVPEMASLPPGYAPLRTGPDDGAARQAETVLEAAFATAPAAAWVG